jgi:hypothetical protein
MSKYQLHKLPEGFIITSSEEVDKNNPAYHYARMQFFDIYDFSESNGSKSFIPKDEFGLPTNIEVLVCDCMKVIAQQHQINFSALSEEEQKEIGWYDVEKLAYDYAYSVQSAPKYGNTIIAFESGFRKAVELLSDRRFTLEDMREAIAESWNSCEDNEDEETFTQVFNRIIQSISQQSWEVEIEMEYDLESIDSSKQVTKPKLTNGKIKIKKIL